jgi:hypothetical protein
MVLKLECLLRHVIEEKIGERIEVTGRQRGRRKQLLGGIKENKRILGVESGSTRLHSLKNLLCRRL